MDAIGTIVTAFPIPTLLVIAAVGLLGSRLRGHGAAATLRQVIVPVACYLLAFGLLSWGSGDSARLWILVVVLGVVAAASLFEIRARRHRPSR